MKLYWDTVNGIREAASFGVLDGVTTNPSLVAKEGRIFRDALVEICNIVDDRSASRLSTSTLMRWSRRGKNLPRSIRTLSSKSHKQGEKHYCPDVRRPHD